MEVFRLSSFDTSKYYQFALWTRTEGVFPNQRYYANVLRYLGKYTHSERWGFGDDASGAEYFDDNGVVNRIEYDYEGKTCFRETQRPDEPNPLVPLFVKDNSDSSIIFTKIGESAHN